MKGVLPSLSGAEGGIVWEGVAEHLDGSGNPPLPSSSGILDSLLGLASLRLGPAELAHSVNTVLTPDGRPQPFDCENSSKTTPGRGETPKMEAIQGRCRHSWIN